MSIELAFQYLVGGAAGALWLGLLLPRLAQGRPLLPSEPRFVIPWRGEHVALVVVMLFLLPQVAVFNLLGPPAGEPAAVTNSAQQQESRPQAPASKQKTQQPTRHYSADQMLQAVAIQAVSSLLLLPVAGWLLWKLAGANWRDLGFVRGKLLSDVALGLLAFAALAAPVYLVQAISQYIWEGQVEEHSITALLKEQSSPVPFLICGLAAAVAAPAVEEVTFRLVLQGWLEKVEDRYGDRGLLRLLPTGRWSILISSVLFAAVHTTWPTPIPLFVFALGLGYLYQQTHRILPCIVTHASLNSVTLILMWLTRGSPT